MSLQQATLHQLAIFSALGKHLSMSRVAKELHLTPAAVSIQIKNLCETVGVPLYEQVGKKLFLTEAGEVLYGGCREMFENLVRLEDKLGAMQGLKGGRLKISVITSAKYFVPHLLGDFCKAHPTVEAALEVCNRNGILERLGQNQDDLYIMGQTPKNFNVTSVPFMENPLVVVATKDHRLAGKKSIDPKNLSEEPFIMREPGSGTRLAAEKFFQDLNIALKIRMVLGSDEAVQQAVTDSLGIAILSRHVLENDRSDHHVTELDVKGFPLTRYWHALYPTGKHLSPAATSFLTFLEGME